MSKSASAVLDSHRSPSHSRMQAAGVPGFKPRQVGDGSTAPHIGQGDVGQLSDRHRPLVNGSSASAWQGHGQNVDITLSQVISSSVSTPKDSGLSSSVRLPSNTPSNTSTTFSSSLTSAASIKKNVGGVGITNRTGLPGGPQQPAVRQMSQSEVISRRPSQDQNHQPINVNPGGSKSAILQRNNSTSGNTAQQAGGNFPEWVYSSTSGHGLPRPTNGAHDTPAAPAALGRPPPAGMATARTPPTPRRTVAYEASMLPATSSELGPGAGGLQPHQTIRPNTNTNLPLLPGATSHAHMSGSRVLGPPTSGGQDSQQHIYRPPMLFSDNAVRIINPDLMGGSRIVPGSGSAGTEHRPLQQGLDTVRPWHGTQVVQQGSERLRPSDDVAVSGSAAGGGGGGGPLNSDRICPVCNRDYSHVTMEDFQTHVFECFDDENAPETMKPDPSLDRTCPMCNNKFSADMPQNEFEAHVHGHFSEESFEMLNRE